MLVIFWMMLWCAYTCTYARTYVQSLDRKKMEAYKSLLAAVAAYKKIVFTMIPWRQCYETTHIQDACNIPATAKSVDLTVRINDPATDNTVDITEVNLHLSNNQIKLSSVVCQIYSTHSSCCIEVTIICSYTSLKKKNYREVSLDFFILLYKISSN